MLQCSALWIVHKSSHPLKGRWVKMTAFKEALVALRPWDPYLNWNGTLVDKKIPVPQYVKLFGIQSDTKYQLVW